MRAVSFSFIWGLTEDYSPGDRLSESSEQLLRRGGEQVSTYVILEKGVCNQAHILVENYCWSQGTVILVNDFSAFLSMGRCRKLGSQKSLLGLPWWRSG